MGAYEEVRARVERAAAGRAVTLIAVSKTRPAEAVRALYELGHRDFGENYAQELVAKAEQLEAWGCKGLRWHFIGHLQSNKAKLIVPWVHAVHAVESPSTAVELAKRRAAAGMNDLLPVFLEVNLDGEASKSGVSPADAATRCAELAAVSGLELRGLMCIPAPRDNTNELRAVFAKLRELELKCRPHTHGGLSMGMSSDFELALAEGATHVRVGTAIFGERTKASR